MHYRRARAERCPGILSPACFDWYECTSPSRFAVRATCIRPASSFRRWAGRTRAPCAHIPDHAGGEVPAVAVERGVHPVGRIVAYHLIGDADPAALGEHVADLLGHHALPDVAGGALAEDVLAFARKHGFHEILQDHRLEFPIGLRDLLRFGPIADVSKSARSLGGIEHRRNVRREAIAVFREARRLKSGAIGLEPRLGLLDLSRIGRADDVHHQIAGRRNSHIRSSQSRSRHLVCRARRCS